jgi:hypothetical protein
MGGLLGGGTKTIEKAQDTVQQTVPQPEPVADTASVGSAKKAEDTTNYGTQQPDLRVDRPTGVSSSSVGTSGSGLKLM